MSEPTEAQIKLAVKIGKTEMTGEKATDLRAELHELCSDNGATFARAMMQARERINGRKGKGNS